MCFLVHYFLFVLFFPTPQLHWSFLAYSVRHMTRLASWLSVFIYSSWQCFYHWTTFSYFYVNSYFIVSYAILSTWLWNSSLYACLVIFLKNIVSVYIWMRYGFLFFKSCADSVIILLRVSRISDFIRGHQKYISDDAEQIKYGKS